MDSLLSPITAAADRSDSTTLLVAKVCPSSSAKASLPSRNTQNLQVGGCLTTCWELLRQVRRLVSQDKSESHRPHPREWRRLQRRLRTCCSTCGGAGGQARMECQATTVPVEEELGLGWQLVYIPLDRDNWPTRVTRPCPRGPEAIGWGPYGVG